jgi:hypothetical protein
MTDFRLLGFLPAGNGVLGTVGPFAGGAGRDEYVAISVDVDHQSPTRYELFVERIHYPDFKQVPGTRRALDHAELAEFESTIAPLEQHEFRVRWVLNSIAQWREKSSGTKAAAEWE